VNSGWIGLERQSRSAHGRGIAYTIGRGQPIGASSSGRRRSMVAVRTGVAGRVAALDWARIGASLDAEGCAVIISVLAPDECESLAATYTDGARFRSRVVMARHGFGRGESQYFAHPLPALVSGLRGELYPPLARVANRWNEALGIEGRYPDEHAAYLERCHRAGQTRPTPLLLQYGE